MFSQLLLVQQICTTCAGGKDQCTILKLQFYCCGIKRDWEEQLKSSAVPCIHTEMPAAEAFSVPEPTASNPLFPMIYFLDIKLTVLLINLSNCICIEIYISPCFFENIFLIVWLSKTSYKNANKSNELSWEMLASPNFNVFKATAAKINLCVCI